MNRTRTGLLALAALGIGLLMLLARGQRGYEPLEPFTLAIAADTHYIAPELTDGGAYFTRIVENGDGKAMQYCEELCRFFAHVNTAYLAGRCDELDWDEAAYEQIREQRSFLMVYLQSILDEGLRDHTSWELTA